MGPEDSVRVLKNERTIRISASEVNKISVMTGFQN